MKKHTIEFALLPEHGTLLGIQHDEIELTNFKTDVKMDGHMIQLGFIFFKIIYIYAPDIE